MEMEKLGGKLLAMAMVMNLMMMGRQFFFLFNLFFLLAMVRCCVTGDGERFF